MLLRSLSSLTAIALASLISFNAWALADESTQKDSEEFTSNQDLVEEDSEEGTITIIGQRPPIASTVGVITEKDIKETASVTVTDAVNLMPGVEVNSGPKEGDSIQVRGLERHALKMLIDGIPINEVYSGAYDFGSLLATGLDKIEVDRGITSVLHGPSSISVVSLKTKEPVKPLEVQAEIIGGNLYKGQFLDLGINGHLGSKLFLGRFGNLKLSVDAAYMNSDGWRLPKSWKENQYNQSYHEDGGLRQASDSERFAGHGKVTWSLRPGTEFSFHIHHFMQDRGVPTLESQNYARHWRFSDYNSTMYAIQAKYRPLNYTEPWGFAGIQTQVSLLNHTDQIDDYQDDKFSQLTQNTLAWFVSSQYENKTINATVTPSFNLADNNKLELTLRYQRDTNKQRDIPVKKDYINTKYDPWTIYGSDQFTVAAEDTLSIKKNLRIVGGFGWTGQQLTKEEHRNKDFKTDDSIIHAYDFRLLSEYTFSDFGRAYLGFAHKTRMPDLKELYSNAVGGNPDLQPEKVFQYEIGLNVSNPKGIKKGLIDLVELRLFYNAHEDMIEKYSVTYENVGKATTAGVELSYRNIIEKVFTTTLSVTYLYAQDEEHDRPLDYRSPWTLAADVRYNAPFNIDLSLQGIWRSGQEGFYNQDGTLIKEELDDYFLLSASARWYMPTIPMYLSLRGQNLLDVNYQRGGYAPNPGRSVLAGLGIKY